MAVYRQLDKQVFHRTGATSNLVAARGRPCSAPVCLQKIRERSDWGLVEKFWLAPSHACLRNTLSAFRPAEA